MQVPDGSERNVRNPAACDLHLAVNCHACIDLARAATTDAFRAANDAYTAWQHLEGKAQELNKQWRAMMAARDPHVCYVGCPHDPGEGHSRAGIARNN